MSPVVSKALWLVFNPANILVGCLVLGALLLFTRWKRTGRFFVAVAALGALAVAYSPLAVWIAVPLEARFPILRALPERVDGIIVLGGAIDTLQSNALKQVSVSGRAERLHAFVELAKRYPSAKLVYSGGAGIFFHEAVSEAEIAKPLLIALGVDEHRLILETKSRDTAENAALSRELVKPKPGENWVLVTSAMHMPRAAGVFRKAEWRVIPYPVDFRQLGEGDEGFGLNLGRGLTLLNAAAREWLSLAHYYMSGRIDSLLPRPG